MLTCAYQLGTFGNILCARPARRTRSLTIEHPTKDASPVYPELPKGASPPERTSRRISLAIRRGTCGERSRIHPNPACPGPSGERPKGVEGSLWLSSKDRHLLFRQSRALRR